MTTDVNELDIITELQRVAKILNTDRLSQKDYQKLGTIGVSKIERRFGSWNNALIKAGLQTASRKGVHIISDDELMIDIINVTGRLKKVPSERELEAYGKFSIKPYKHRWGSLRNAREEAYKKYGLPPGVDVRFVNPSAEEKPSALLRGQERASSATFANKPSLKPHLLQISNPDTRAFVEEAINCMEHKLFRSAVVMSWIGAVSVLYDHVLMNRLADFNAEAKRRDPKWKIATNRDDLTLMKESDFLDVLAAISVLGKTTKEQLKNCLNLRNACGHPNTFKLGHSIVEAHLETLILNVFEQF